MRRFFELKSISFVFFTLVSPLGIAASFDCAKAATSVEKLICSNEYVSGLDEELGQVYKEALVIYADKKDMIVRQQRNWIKWIRSQCSDPSCLATLYEARIGELVDGNNVAALNGPDKPNFILTSGRGHPLCEEYLGVLNDTPREELRACKLPDFSKSKIKPVEFKQLTGKELKAIDRIIYEQNSGGPRTDWEQKWPEREREYAVGYRLLGVSYWDLNNDGESDEIFEESIPYSRCILPNNGLIEDERKRIDEKWKVLNTSEKIIKAEKYGFKKFYSTVKAGKLIRIDSDMFLFFDGAHLSTNHAQLNRINTTTEWADKNLIEITRIDNKLDRSGKRYSRLSTECKFWFNK